MRLLIVAGLMAMTFGCTSVEKPKPEVVSSSTEGLPSTQMRFKPQEDQPNPQQRLPEKRIKFERLDGYIGP